MKSEYKMKDWAIALIVILASSLLLLLEKGTIVYCVLFTVCSLLVCYAIYRWFPNVKWKALFQDHRYGELVFCCVCCGIFLFFIFRYIIDLFQVWAKLV